jgi:hypothetical protein
MNDRHAHFLVLVGNLCNDARTGAFAVEVRTEDGRLHEGVPDPTPAYRGATEIDDSGWAEDLRINGGQVRLQDVREIRVVRP